MTVDPDAQPPPHRASGYRQPPDWPQTRRRILNRDHGICQLCGKPGADTVDHIVPVSQHGRHDDDNLQAAHQAPCHAAKTEQERLQSLRSRSRRRPERRNPNLI